MPISELTGTIAQVTTTVSLISVGLFGLSWVVGSLLKGSPIPFREWKEAGNEMQLQAIKATFMLSLYSAIATLLAWIVNAIASAG
jgi:preprotein translocase subunit SecE